MINIEELLDNQGYWDSIEQCKIAEYIHQLHYQINILEAEVADIKNASDSVNPNDEKFIALGEQVVELTQQIAASQLREQQLREVIDDKQWEKDGNVHAHNLRVQEALAMPPDTTALESLIAKISKVVVTKAKQACIDLGAKGIDYFNYTSFVEAIDNLPPITLNDLK